MRDKTPIREQVAQRKHTTPQRVKPLTLGDLERGGVKHIECECGWCRHEGNIDLAPLLEKAGADALYRDVSQHFLCSNCGWRGVNAWPIWPGGKGYRRPARKIPALPPIKECREVLTAVEVRPSDLLVEKRGAYIHALRERWPELTASAALFVVNELRPWER
jgi:hypothetical protein